MVPQSCLLDFIRLKSPHTGENIHETTERILDRFNMKEKVYKIVTDNTSSMIKAYKFGLSVDDEIIDDDNEVQLMANAHTTFNAFNPMALNSIYNHRKFRTKRFKDLS
ncbi:unnamed protein product [Rotaria magnacalcarata]|uniref:DUF659 domain-containing protein n=2 Tax=Rotaria magnacalcarata TaxID=392030 RepID=A0A8S3JKI2_9BILA|nr:unnamed protein product [Rotaria magnacalcarata]